MRASFVRVGLSPEVLSIAFQAVVDGDIVAEVFLQGPVNGAAATDALSLTQPIRVDRAALTCLSGCKAIVGWEARQ
jgi:hypothetical protein